jgi:transposase
MLAEIKQLPNNIDSLKEIINQYQLHVKIIEEENRLLKDKLFNHKSEKWKWSDEEKLQGRLFDEGESGSEDSESKDEDKVLRISGYTRRKGGRRPLPESLPRIDVVHDLSEEEKICNCGAELSKIGEEVSEKLDIIPAKLQVLRHIRYKYACRNCEGVESEETGGAVKTAPLSPQIIPQGIATPGLLAYILTGKFVDALPFYRQEKIFNRLGIDLPRSTMCNWAIQIHNRYGELISLIWDDLLSCPLIGIDETTVQVLEEPERRNTARSYMWAFRGGGVERPVLLYEYAPTRSTKFVVEYLEEYSGFIQTDGYAGYNEVGKLKMIIHAGCWSHARRKFVEASKGSREGNDAHVAVDFIRKLYAIEKELREKSLSHDKICEARRIRSQPILESFKKWLDKKVHHVPPKSLMGKAIGYTLKEWPKLLIFLTDGRIPIDNNLVENAIRPFVVGRKNWLFSGSPRGADASAFIYSLIETAKANDIEPYWYLRYLFEKLPYAQSRDDLNLLQPNRVDRDKIAEFRRGGVN